MAAPIEIGDIVATDDGTKMVVSIWRDASKQLLVSCVDTDDSPTGEDVMPKAMTYRRMDVRVF